MKKTQVLDAIQDMPEDIAIDVLMEKLIVLQKIEEGQKQIKEGKVYTEEEAEKKLEKWLR
jgi:predicted transcriptional regulator